MPNNSLHSWSELPAELLQYILQEIEDSKSIFQCLLVCKAWSKAAEQFSYRTIDLSSYSVQLKNLVNTLQSSEHLGKRVNQINFNITIRKPQKSWDRSGFFEKLIDCCPNVKVVTAKGSCHGLWTQLLTKRHKWKNLQEIPRPFHDRDMEAYTKTALEFNDRLTNLILRLYYGVYVHFFSHRHQCRCLPSYLSTFKCLKHLEIHGTDKLKLEEVDIILDNCPKLTSFAALQIRESGMSEYNYLIIPVISRPLELLDKINLFKPKTSLRKLNFSFTIDGGDEVLIYIMRVLPNLETLYLNQAIDKTNLVCSDPVIISFLQYSLNRKTIDVKYLACEDPASLLPIFWQSEEYIAVNKKEVYLTIEESNSTGTRSTRKPYISMDTRREITVSYRAFKETSSPVELIEEIGLLITSLKIKFNYPNFSSTKAMYQGHILDHIFENCPSLKKIECSFYFLQSCNPKLSINTSIEELVLNSIEVHSYVLEQLSIRLPNLKVMSFMESEYIKYDGRYISKKKLDINMQCTRFDKLYIARKVTAVKYYSDLFLKLSNENGDNYFYTDLKSDFTEFSKCSQMEYYDKLTSKKTYFINLRCQDVRELTVKLGSMKIKLLA
ncbi:hypothetical protein INT48_008477 [Thamnidium elegans]|uniref:F-box domain-containing protein n=1 Tax=Thamnidium elegans TaxID=101142 RepID=A0A8H7SMQ8_9FUNG|nr:hypothetical protein INT48_008477 [Thamnidium elegans]